MTEGKRVERTLIKYTVVPSIWRQPVSPYLFWSFSWLNGGNYIWWLNTAIWFLPPWDCIIFIEIRKFSASFYLGLLYNTTSGTFKDAGASLANALIKHRPGLLMEWLGDDDNLSVHDGSTCHKFPVSLFSLARSLCFHEIRGQLIPRIPFWEFFFLELVCISPDSGKKQMAHLNGVTLKTLIREAILTFRPEEAREETVRSWKELHVCKKGAQQELWP